MQLPQRTFQQNEMANSTTAMGKGTIKLCSLLRLQVSSRNVTSNNVYIYIRYTHVNIQRGSSKSPEQRTTQGCRMVQVHNSLPERAKHAKLEAHQRIVFLLRIIVLLCLVIIFSKRTRQLPPLQLISKPSYKINVDIA